MYKQPIKLQVSINPTELPKYDVGTKHQFFDQEYEVAGYLYDFVSPYWVDVDLTLWPVQKPKSERQLMLEQSIKYHTQQIEHHEMMRKKFEEELKNEGC